MATRAHKFYLALRFFIIIVAAAVAASLVAVVVVIVVIPFASHLSEVQTAQTKNDSVHCEL